MKEKSSWHCISPCPDARFTCDNCTITLLTPLKDGRPVIAKPTRCLQYTMSVSWEPVNLSELVEYPDPEWSE